MSVVINLVSAVIKVIIRSQSVNEFEGTFECLQGYLKSLGLVLVELKRQGLHTQDPQPPVTLNCCCRAPPFSSTH